jgi:hypothetical protein
MICDVCGSDSCVTPVFCRTCRDRDAQRQRAQRTWRDGLITAKDLQSKTFDAVRIILPGLIPEGVTILAGKPKIGKSWFLLDVCMAVAGNRFVLGETKPVQGDVLYLALEDNQRRLKKRTDKIMQGAATWPEPLEIHTEWRRVDQGGLDDIKEWCEAKPARRLICIDTLAKIRPIAGKNELAYGFDYRAIEGLQKLAGQYQIGIVLSHHLRKAASEDDVFDDVSGTLGLTGAADAIVILKRYSGMVKVHVRGRDIEEAEFAAEFNKDTCRWRLVGEADEVFRSQQRQAIATVLKEAKRPMSVPEIMAATERSDRNAIAILLHKMEKTGEVRHVGRGLWAHPDLRDSGNNGNKETKGSQTTDNNEKAGTRECFRNISAAETGNIAGNISEGTNPLTGNGRSSECFHISDVTGLYRADDPGPFPDCLRRSPLTATSSAVRQ